MKKVRGWRVSAFAQPGSAEFCHFDQPGAKAKAHCIYELFPDAADQVFAIAIRNGTATLDFGVFEVLDV